MKDLTTLREHLFGTLDALRDSANPMDLDRAKTIAEVAQQVVNTAKVEVDFLRATGQQHGSGFIPALPKTPAETKPGTPEQPRLVTGRAHSGSR